MKLKILALCNQFEAEIAELNGTEDLLFLKDLGVEEIGLNKLIHKSYEFIS